MFVFSKDFPVLKSKGRINKYTAKENFRNFSFWFADGQFPVHDNLWVVFQLSVLCGGQKLSENLHLKSYSNFRPSLSKQNYC